MLPCLIVNGSCMCLEDGCTSRGSFDGISAHLGNLYDGASALALSISLPPSRLCLILFSFTCLSRTWPRSFFASKFQRHGTDHACGRKPSLINSLSSPLLPLYVFRPSGSKHRTSISLLILFNVQHQASSAGPSRRRRTGLSLIIGLSRRLIANPQALFHTFCCFNSFGIHDLAQSAEYHYHP